MLTKEERAELREKAEADRRPAEGYEDPVSPHEVLSLLDYIDDMERRILAADRAVATAAQTIASLREHMASGGATARVQELTRELHEVRRQLREVTQERDALRAAPLPTGPSVEFVAVEDGQEIVFRFASSDEAWIFINDDTARPVLVGDLDEDSTPFFLTCPEQHAGDRFRITIVRPAK